jgi:ATP-dependent DNA ligase
MSSFPVLFGSSSAGKTKTWSVVVVERDGCGVIQTSRGYVGGKQVMTERVVKEGKNLGKKNATTAIEQALKEAQSDWTAKTEKEGYAATSAMILGSSATVAARGGAGGPAAERSDGESGAAAAAAPVAAIAADAVPRPMLAHSFDKRSKDIKYPCYAQKKLDGVRCVAIQGKGLFSRNAKPFPHLDHIRAEIASLPSGLILDGELYSDTLGFQEIVGLVKKTKLVPADAARLSQIYLCVYDTISTETYEARKTSLDALFASRSFKALKLLPTDECRTKEDVNQYHDAYVAEGFEGLILRNKTGLYAVNYRSKDLQKYKEFLDAEFDITGFTVGVGTDEGCVIWTCRTDEGKEFSCRPKGTVESRREAVATAAAQVGKKLTIRFQEWTDDRKPRFPVGQAFRDYE